ncbi:MAG: hypothetical protein HC799_15815 [Limnothrix sp. RL_2_0]|nr:hypothetical protein [Limnothrix sp. RL_2_0]
MDILIDNFLVLCFILILVTLIWWLWYEMQKQKRRRKRGAIVLRSSKASRSPQSRTSTKDSSIKRQLIGLLHGDRQAVERLIDSAQTRQPGKSQKWYEEKVLHDLDRDRR